MAYECNSFFDPKALRKAYFKSRHYREDYEYAQHIHMLNITDPEYDAHQYTAYQGARKEFTEQNQNCPSWALAPKALRAFSQNAEDSLTARISFTDIAAFDTKDVLFDSKVMQLNFLRRFKNTREKYINGLMTEMDLMQDEVLNIFVINRLCTLNLALNKVDDILVPRTFDKYANNG